MIQVIYHRGQHKVTVKGHAQSGEAGHDLVCAAASALAYTLAANVANMADKELVQEPVMSLKPGDTEVSCQPDSDYTSTVAMVFDAVCVGFELLYDNYPAYISYEIR